MKKSKILLPLALLGLVFGVAACNGGEKKEGGEDTPTSQVTPGKEEKITITAKDDKKTLILGETVQLTASVDGVTWESKKPEVATVDANGLVTSVGVGSTTITASKEGYKSGTISIKVDLKDIIVTAQGETTLLAGQTVQLKADQEGVTWESSDPTVATVSDVGLVTAIKFGTATITASKEGFDSAKTTINVVRPEVNAKFDLTTDADHFSADGWWELGGSGMFAMQQITGWNPISQNRSWGQQEENPETFIGGFGEGDKETVKFTSDKANKAELVLDMGNSSAVTLSEVMSIKLNDTAMDLSAFVLEEHAGQFGASLEFAELSLGEYNLVVGENTLEFTFLADTNIFLNEVHVYAGDAKVVLVPPVVKEQIEVKEAKLEVIEGETVQIESEITGVSYASVDVETATVDENGVVTGVKTGIVNITVMKEGMYSVRVQITVKPAPVAGQILLEVENAEELLTEEGVEGAHISKDGQGGFGGNAVHSGGAYVSFYQASEVTLTMKFTAEAASTMVLSVVGSAPMSFGGEAAPYVFKDSMVITFNEEAFTPAEEANFPAPEGWSSTMSEVVLGDVAVKAGENVLVIKLADTFPSLDVFKLSVKA